MATMQIETLANDFVEIIAQQVSRELKKRLATLEAKAHHFTFKKLDDLQAEVQGLRECNAANFQVMRSQQEKIDHLENIFDRLEVTGLSKTLVESVVDDAFQEFDIDYKIERAIRACDFSEYVERALGDVDFTNYGLLTKHDLIKFLNDRVRITVE